MKPRMDEGPCRTYKSDIVSNDGEMKDASTVFEFVRRQNFRHEDSRRGTIAAGFNGDGSDIELVRNEDVAYQKLMFVQGFYSSHLVSCIAQNIEIALT